MATDNEFESKLPVVLTDVDFQYKKPEQRNALVPQERYDAVDKAVETNVKLGTDGGGYVGSDAFPSLFGLSKPKAAYVFANQIPEKEKINFGDTQYAKSSAVVGLLDKKSQDVLHADTQAILQYGRDSILNVTDSPQAQDLRRKRDTLIHRELPKMRNARGVKVDEVTGENLRPGAAFHHLNPKEIHTDPVDIVNPGKGRNINKDTHIEVHQKNINDEAQFEEYKKQKQKGNPK